MSKEICRTNEQREIHRKKRVLEHAERTGNVHETMPVLRRREVDFLPLASQISRARR